jgi:rare lipoprotein A
MSRRVSISATVAFAFLMLSSPRSLPKDAEHVLERGIASWYGAFHHGRQTANGEIFDSAAMTAAHQKLAFGTLVRVTSERTSRSIVVRINDRGPFVRGRVIDLPFAAAQSVGLEGVGPVVIARDHEAPALLSHLSEYSEPP